MHSSKDDVSEIEINQEPIDLCQLLKFAGLAETGGEAKIAIINGLVKVNGSVETRRGKKIMAGDVIEFEGQKMRVALAD